MDGAGSHPFRRRTAPARLQHRPAQLPACSETRLGVLVAVTLLYIVLQNLMISYARQLAPTGRMAIVTFTMPMWTTVLAALFLGERINRTRVTHPYI